MEGIYSVWIIIVTFCLILMIIKIIVWIFSLLKSISIQIASGFDSMRRDKIDRIIQNRPGRATNNINPRDYRNEERSQYPRYSE